ncbi:hypothetical protein L0Y69_03170 [bacterium]|nr:hypothetical protein [bacterium]
MITTNFGHSIKSNIPLVIGLLLPVLMILFVAGSIYLPRLGEQAQPQYDFLYMADQTYDLLPYVYLVRNGKLVKEARPVYELPTKTAGITVLEDSQKTPFDVTKFYIYDVEKNESREVSFDDTSALSLDAHMESPDDFKVTQNYGNGGGIFSEIFGGGHEYGRWYLVGNGSTLKLELENGASGRYYYDNIQFLGWVMK